MSDLNLSDAPELTEGIVYRLLNSAESHIVNQAIQISLDGVFRRNQESVLATVEENTQSEVNSVTNDLGNSLTEMSQAWLEDATGQLCMVPEGTRYFTREGAFMNVLTEYAPGLRRIVYRRNGRNGEAIQRVFELAMPFVQFVSVFRMSGRQMVFDKLRVSCSKSPVVNLEAPVHKLPLPNVGLGGPFVVCTGRGSGGMATAVARDSVIDKVNTNVTGFWQSEFNTDLSDPLYQFLVANMGLDASQRGSNDAVFAAMERWQERSRQNPMFMLEEGVQLSSTVRVGSLIESDITTRSGKMAFKNRIKTTINNGMSALTTRLCNTFRVNDVNESNVPAVHQQSIRSVMQLWLNAGYREIRDALRNHYTQEVRTITSAVRERETSVQRREARLESDRARLRQERQEYESAKLREQVQIHQTHVALQQRAAELAERERRLAEGQPVANATPTVVALAPAPLDGGVAVPARTRRPRRAATPAPAPTNDPTAPRGPGQVRVSGSIWDDLDADILVG